MKMYIVALLNKFEVIKSENTPSEIEFVFQKIKFGSAHPMLIKLKKRT